MLINLNTSPIMILLRNGITKSANIVAKRTKWSRAVAQIMERPVHIVKSRTTMPYNVPRKTDVFIKSTTNRAKTPQKPLMMSGLMHLQHQDLGKMSSAGC